MKKNNWLKGIKISSIIIVYLVMLLLILTSIAIIRAHSDEGERAKLPHLFGMSFMRATDDLTKGEYSKKIDKDDLIFVKMLESNSRLDFSKGDIVIFYDYSKGDFHSSRIEKINNNLITVKCDNDSVSRILSSSEILAIYQGKVNKGGTILNTLESTWGFILIIILPISILLIYQGYALVKVIIQINKDAKEQRDDTADEENIV